MQHSGKWNTTSQILKPKNIKLRDINGLTSSQIKKMSVRCRSQEKVYIWKLAEFLHKQDMTMSGEELADHLNRNSFLTSYGTQYQGGRGTYKLIRETWQWLNNDLGLNKEAEHVALAFVKSDGSYAYE